ncbi:MAG: hypothetical protein SV583_04500 [Pseudomonadota bacterium]|nr:hypothetical protein [Pseudomonadota bacterium]
MAMKTMHKHEIPITDQPIEIDLQVGAVVHRVEFLVPDKKVYMWVEVDANLNAPKKTRIFHVYRSGDGVPKHYHYVGTAIDQYIPEAYHVYEKIE